MINISKIEKFTIYYNCDCGVIGECMFKPPQKSSIIIMDIECPMCKSEDRVKVLKYDSEEEKAKLLSGDDVDFYWSTIIDNKVLEN